MTSSLSVSTSKPFDSPRAKAEDKGLIQDARGASFFSHVRQTQNEIKKNYENFCFLNSKNSDQPKILLKKKVNLN